MDARGLPVSSALQELFKEMQTSNSTASTDNLTSALGWDDLGQEDALDRTNLFLYKLEEELKTISQENLVKKYAFTYCSLVEKPNDCLNSLHRFFANSIGGTFLCENSTEALDEYFSSDWVGDMGRFLPLPVFEMSNLNESLRFV